ncbi:hypothetical protein [Maribacter sp. 2308TA10-17]|uniref:hypothetical protein n=1 Tax=Maribacter sp. 2308TA10-17 TaxID=3386276 RepID=UPI0039BCAA31
MLRTKNVLTYLFVFLLIYSCSKSDSNEPEPENTPSLSIPKVTTAAISEITESTAISGGNVTDDGGATITERGVCWSTSTEPTVSDNKTTNATGIGVFSSSLEGLDANTAYFLRAYATNNEGTAYGNEISFTTLEPEPIAKVYEGDLVLTTQQEVDDFGAEGFTAISGSLKIKDSNVPSTIVNLNPLNTISTISDSLIIEENLILNELNGFIELKNVGADISIIRNKALQSINTFEKLEEVGGDIIFFAEEAVYSISGFNNLLTIAGGLYLINNSQGAVSELNAFNNLETIGTDLSINRINGNLVGLNKLNSIGAKLTIQGLSTIEDFTFFESLTNIGGRVNVTANPVLESFNGFEKLTGLNGLSLLLNNSLTSLNGLENIRSIYGNLVITINRNLENLQGLEGLEKVLNGGVDINQNMSLTSLNGLNNLKTIDQGLEIWRNDSLENLTGLESLNSTGFGEACTICFGRIRIESNENLLNIDALENLTSNWYGNIKISYNEKLVNLDGLRNLVNIYRFPQDTRVNGAIIENNSNLNDVCGLKNVYDNNSSRFYVEGFFNGTENNPEGDARAMLNLCD